MHSLKKSRVKHAELFALFCTLQEVFLESLILQYYQIYKFKTMLWLIKSTCISQILCLSIWMI